MKPRHLYCKKHPSSPSALPGLEPLWHCAEGGRILRAVPQTQDVYTQTHQMAALYVKYEHLNDFHVILISSMSGDSASSCLPGDEEVWYD